MAGDYLTEEEIDRLYDLEEGFQLLRSFNVKIKSVNSISEVKTKLRSIIRSQFQQGKDLTTVLSTAINDSQQKCQSMYEIYQKAPDIITALDEASLKYIALRVGNYQTYLDQTILSLKSGSKTICIIDHWDASNQGSPFLALLLANTEIPMESCLAEADICLVRYGTDKKLILAPYSNSLDESPRDKKRYQSLVCELDDYQSFEEQACYYLQRYRGENKFKLIEIEWPLPSLKDSCQIVNINGFAYNGETKSSILDWLQSSILRIHIVRDIARLNHEMSQLTQGFHSIGDMKTLALWSNSSVFVYNIDTENDTNSCLDDKKITSILQNIWPEWKTIPIYSINIHQEKTNIIHHQLTDIFYQVLHQFKKTIQDHCKLQLEIYYRWLQKLLNYAEFADHFRQYCEKLPLEERKLHQSQLQIKLIDIARFLRKIHAKREPTMLPETVKINTQDFLQLLNLKLLRLINETNSTFLDKYSLLCNQTVTDFRDILSMVIDQLDLQVTQFEIENRLLLVAKQNYIKDLLSSHDESKVLIDYFEGLMLGFNDLQDNISLLTLNNFIPSQCIITNTTSKINLFLNHPILLKANYPTSLGLFNAQHQHFIQVLQESMDGQPASNRIKVCITKVLHHFTDDNIQREMINHELRPIGYHFHEWLEDFVKLTEYYAWLIQEQDYSATSNQGNRDHLITPNANIKNLQRSLAYCFVLSIENDVHRYGRNDLDTIAVDTVIGTGIIGQCHHGTGRIDQSNSQPLLIKRLYDDISKDNAFEYFIEIDALRKLKHKNIIQYYGSIRRYGIKLQIDMLLESCRNNLRFLLESNHQLIPSHFTITGYPKYRARLLFFNLASQIINGLQFLHRNGYLHRDLKLDNVLINEDFIVKLTEIGQANLAKTTASNVISNSIIYSAPEIFKKQFINHKADIYSFSLMLWEMWYGKRAFNQDFEIKFILNGHRPSMDAECQPETHLKDLIQSCWDNNPKCRPSSEKCFRILRGCFEELAMLETDDLLPQLRGRKISRSIGYTPKKISTSNESIIYRV
ncbi:Serine/threonine-protein kinase STY8 [Trichoplax sp. H2]|nr:Serine/threonine-protein kinase STY8 [Trichoplax sp. H2]|eukprot:RDD37012.1 Serine/threonine-protein kinase STY8 [Trichoplax sp. H2]